MKSTLSRCLLLVEFSLGDPESALNGRMSREFMDGRSGFLLMPDASVSCKLSRKKSYSPTPNHRTGIFDKVEDANWGGKADKITYRRRL